MSSRRTTQATKDKAKKTEHLSAFGIKLKADRRAKGLTQADLAAFLGCARSTVAMIETGHMAAFDNDEYYDELAKQLGGTGVEWKDLAERSRTAFRLSGVGISDEHRKAGSTLEKYWADLPAEVLRAITQTIMHKMGGGGERSGGSGGKKG